MRNKEKRTAKTHYFCIKMCCIDTNYVITKIDVCDFDTKIDVCDFDTKNRCM